ncbi:unnamed protein product [Amaranthus hypochondriacus]
MRKAKSTGGIKKHTHIPLEPNADPMEHNEVPPVPGASVPMIPAVVEVPTDQEVPPVDSTGPGSSPSRLAPSLISLSSVGLRNEFSVLSVEHDSDVLDGPSVIIALGADPIGGDD